MSLKLPADTADLLYAVTKVGKLCFCFLDLRNTQSSQQFASDKEIILISFHHLNLTVVYLSLQSVQVVSPHVGSLFTDGTLCSLQCPTQLTTNALKPLQQLC